MRQGERKGRSIERPAELSMLYLQPSAAALPLQDRFGGRGAVGGDGGRIVCRGQVEIVPAARLRGSCEADEAQYGDESHQDLAHYSYSLSGRER